ncbi:MAG TPA: T9SS type A sorting domain-containing protein [Candidatus Cloacimonadota bacterium]|nr:T9SS type A sorting domain-containing protein [Candidatus Cloacimonadota bacterium]
MKRIFLSLFLLLALHLSLFAIGDGSFDNPYTTEILPLIPNPNNNYFIGRIYKQSNTTYKINYNGANYSVDSGFVDNYIKPYFNMTGSSSTFVTSYLLFQYNSVNGSPQTITLQDFCLLDTYSSHFQNPHEYLLKNLYGVKTGSSTTSAIEHFVKDTELNPVSWAINHDPVYNDEDIFGLQKMTENAYKGLVTERNASKVESAKVALYRFFTSTNTNGKKLYEIFCNASFKRNLTDYNDYHVQPGDFTDGRYEAVNYFIDTNVNDDQYNYYRERNFATGLNFIAISYDILYYTFTSAERTEIETAMGIFNHECWAFMGDEGNWQNFWHRCLSAGGLVNYKNFNATNIQCTDYMTMYAGMGYLALFKDPDNNILQGVKDTFIHFNDTDNQYTFTKAGIYTAGLTYQSRALYLPSLFFTALNRKEGMNLWNSPFMNNCMKATLARVDNSGGHLIENDEWRNEDNPEEGGSRTDRIMRGILPYYFQNTNSSDDTKDVIGWYMHKLIDNSQLLSNLYPDQANADGVPSNIDFVLSYNPSVLDNFTSSTNNPLFNDELYSDEEMTIMRPDLNTNEDDSYLYINHEHSRRTNHKQDEKTNFQLYYHQIPIIINSGYYRYNDSVADDNWDSRTWIASSYAKNLVIADPNYAEEETFITHRWVTPDTTGFLELKSPFSSNEWCYRNNDYAFITPAIKEMQLDSNTGIKHAKVSTEYNNESYDEITRVNPIASGHPNAQVNRNFYKIPDEETYFIYDEVLNLSGINHTYSDQIHLAVGCIPQLINTSYPNLYKTSIPGNADKLYLAMGDNLGASTNCTTVPEAWDAGLDGWHTRIRTEPTALSTSNHSFLITLNILDSDVTQFYTKKGSNYFITYRTIGNELTIAGVTNGASNITVPGITPAFQTDAKFFYVCYNTNLNKIEKLVVNTGTYFNTSTINCFYCISPTMEEVMIKYSGDSDSYDHANIDYIVKKYAQNPAYSMYFAKQGINNLNNVTFTPHLYSPDGSVNFKIQETVPDNLKKTIDGNKLRITSYDKNRFITLKSMVTGTCNTLSVYEKGSESFPITGTSPAGVPFTQIVSGNFDGGADDEIACLYKVYGYYKFQIYNPGATDTPTYPYGYGAPAYSQIDCIGTGMSRDGVIMKSGDCNHDGIDEVVFYCPGTSSIPDSILVVSTTGLPTKIYSSIGLNGGVRYTHMVIGDFNNDTWDEIYLYRNYNGIGLQTSSYYLNTPLHAPIENFGTHISSAYGPATTNGTVTLQNILMDKINADSEPDCELVMHFQSKTNKYGPLSTFDKIYNFDTNMHFSLIDSLSGSNNVSTTNYFTSIATGDFDNDGQDELGLQLKTSDEDGYGLISIYKLGSGYNGNSPGYYHMHIEPGQDMIASFNAYLTGETGRGQESPEVSPMVFSLKQNYPNPFVKNTKIEFSLAQDSKISLLIYNIKGQLVRQLVNETKAVGSHTIDWDGTNMQESRVASGIYFYRLDNGKKVITKKMLLLK